MRVLLVNDYGAPMYGAELQMLALRDSLRARGHAVELFSSRAELVPGRTSQADSTCFGATGHLQVLSQCLNPSAYLGLRRVLARFKPDVVHVRMFLWQLSPLILPLLRRVPSLYQIVVYKDVCPKGSKLLPDGAACVDPYGLACLRHGCVTPQSWAPAMLQLGLLARWRSAFRRTVVLSGPMRDVLAANGLQRFEVVHNGVAARPPRLPLQGLPLLAYAGRLSAEKGVGVLLQAFAQALHQVPDAALLIAGDGEAEPALRREAVALGIADRVRWLGHLPRAAMETAFDPAWAQAVPSLWQEPFGNVTSEAMMRGTALVASDVGGASDLVEDGRTGLLVPPGDTEALRAALVRVLGRAEEAERLGAAGRAYAVEHLGQDRVVSRFETIYAELADPDARVAA